MLNELMTQAKNLSPEERNLLKQYLDSLDTLYEQKPKPKRRLSELRGLGKEIWTGIDAQDYINQLRDEWDEHP